MRALLIWALAVTVMLVVVAPAGALTRYTNPNFKPDGRVTLSPDQKELEVVPGREGSVTVTILNGTEQTLDAKLTGVDLKASEDPDGLTQLATDARYGAGAWLRPEVDSVTLQPGEQVQVNIAISPPGDAPVGTNYGGLKVEFQGSPGKEVGGGAKVAFKFSALSQLFLNIPGEVKRDTRIVSARITDRFVFGSASFVAYEVLMENKGTVNDHIGGSIVINSLFGNRVEKLELKKAVIPRDGRRRVRAVWSDPPRFGRFTAEADIQTDSDEEKASFPAVLILPHKGFIALFGVAVLLPLAYTIWNRRRNTWDPDEDEWEDPHGEEA